MSQLLSISSVFVSAMYIVLAIFVLLLMIMIHELGHYTAGKLLKFKINEFSIGFGKSIFQKTTKTGEKISLRLFPLGGYCAFEGEDEDGKDNPEASLNELVDIINEIYEDNITKSGLNHRLRKLKENHKRDYFLNYVHLVRNYFEIIRWLLIRVYGY